MKAEGEQMSIFDLDIWCGKMSQEHLVQESQKEQTFKRSYKKSAKSSAKTFPLFLSLKRVGTMQETSMEWEMTGLPLAYLGDSTMLNTGVFPKDEEEYVSLLTSGGVTASKILFELWGETEQNNPNIPIADFGNESEPEVQSERQGLQRNTEESRNEREGITGTSENNIGETISFQERAGKPGGVKESSYNEREQEHCQPSITNPSLTQSDSVCYGISSYDSNAMKSLNPHSGIYEAETTRTLDLNGGNPACNQGGMAVVSVDRSLTVNEGRTNALLSDDKDNPNICYGLDRASFNQGKNAKYDFSVEEEIAQPLVARGPGGGG